MGKIAFLMAGQGAQYPGMVKDLYDNVACVKELFDNAEKVRPGTKEQCFEADKEVLNETKNTQPCMFLADVACALAAMDKGIKPDYIAGFSLGEIAALYLSGILSLEEAFDLVTLRGQLMSDAASKNVGGMLAVLTKEKDKLLSLCKEAGVYPVNFNCPGQIVVSGLKDKIDEFAKVLADEGMRAVPLAVSGPFHTPYMESASNGLREKMATLTYNKMTIPMYSNVTATVYEDNKDAIIDNVTKQVMNPVRWEETLLDMEKRGIDTYIECGPGKVLQGLVKKTLKDVTILGINNMESLEAAANA